MSTDRSPKRYALSGLTVLCVCASSVISFTVARLTGFAPHEAFSSPGQHHGNHSGVDFEKHKPPAGFHAAHDGHHVVPPFAGNHPDRPLNDAEGGPPDRHDNQRADRHNFVEVHSFDGSFGGDVPPHHEEFFPAGPERGVPGDLREPNPDHFGHPEPHRFPHEDKKEWEKHDWDEEKHEDWEDHDWDDEKDWEDHEEWNEHDDWKEEMKNHEEEEKRWKEEMKKHEEEMKRHEEEERKRMEEEEKRWKEEMKKHEEDEKWHDEAYDPEKDEYTDWKEEDGEEWDHEEPKDFGEDNYQDKLVDMLMRVEERMIHAAVELNEPMYEDAIEKIGDIRAETESRDFVGKEEFAQAREEVEEYVMELKEQVQKHRESRKEEEYGNDHDYEDYDKHEHEEYEHEEEFKPDYSAELRDISSTILEHIAEAQSENVPPEMAEGLKKLENYLTEVQSFADKGDVTEEHIERVMESLERFHTQMEKQARNQRPERRHEEDRRGGPQHGGGTERLTEMQEEVDEMVQIVSSKFLPALAAENITLDDLALDAFASAKNAAGIARTACSTTSHGKCKAAVRASLGHFRTMEEVVMAQAEDDEHLRSVIERLFEEEGHEEDEDMHNEDWDHRGREDWDEDEDDWEDDEYDEDWDDDEDDYEDFDDEDWEEVDDDEDDWDEYDEDTMSTQEF